MPLSNLPPVVSDPGLLLPPGQTNPGQTSVLVSWNWFRQWYGDDYREAIGQVDAIISFTTSNITY